MPKEAFRTKNHLYLIDGSGYIFRAYHALPAMNRADGTPVNAVYGYSSMILKLLQDLKEGDKPTHIAVIFDAGRKTFRNDFYPDYKAHRPPAPEDLVPQFPLIREATEAFQLPAIELQGFEADDIIATYARQADAKGWIVTIVSSDKDLMQLVNEQISMFDSMKNKRINTEGVFEKFGVGPDKVVDVQALAGDSSDNVPGVPGIGIKTAAELINEYGDLESLLARAGEIKQPKRRENLIEFAELARISLRLVTLKDDLSLDLDLSDMKTRQIEPGPLLEFMEAQGFKSLKAKLSTLFGVEQVVDDLAAKDGAVEKTSYECVQDMDALGRWIKKIQLAGQVAVDTETTSLNAVSAELVGISLSVRTGEACYIPLGHKGSDGEGLALGGDRPEQIEKTKALQALRPMLEDPAILKIGQNLKYDYLIFLQNGIALSPLEDTMLISYALECGLHGHGLDELSNLHLGIKPISFKEVAGTGKNQVTFDYVPLDSAVDYAAEDADLTGRLHRILKPRLADEGLLNLYENLERPLIPVLARMEQEGIKVDRAQLNHLSGEFGKRMQKLEIQIHKLAGREFNIASPRQLGEILFDEMNMPSSKKGKAGAFSTSAAILEGLALEGHELPRKVLDWRQLAKLKSTYTDALQKAINPNTGRVHTSFSLAATSTGRLASSNPNLQNIPIRTEMGRKIREAFIAEPGHKLVAADYSQIELRILAHMADIKALKEAFANGVDIHALTASEVFAIPIEGMDPLVRRRAKAINFGIIYGISAFGLANQLGISREEAGKYISAYFKKFPGIRDYMDETKAYCKDHGYVTTLFGRRCHIRAIHDKNPAMRSFGERAAINAPIQGSAADIIRRAMIRIPGALEAAGLEKKVKMLLQVHDELIFEIPDGVIESAIPVIKTTMEEAALPYVDLSVPLTVDCGVGQNWNDAH